MKHLSLEDLKHFVIKTTAILSLAPLMLLAALDEPVVTYYFNQGGICTGIVDFQSARSKLESADKETMLLLLTRRMIGEVIQDFPTRCDGATDVRMIAVYIPGVDNYGRPDFANRINLLRLDGDRDGFLMKDSVELKSLEDVKRLFSITEF